jgi:hypothetical protein
MARTILKFGGLIPVSATGQTFPIELARQIIPQFKDCRGLMAIPKGKPFVHEEKPEAVSEARLACSQS